MLEAAPRYRKLNPTLRRVFGEKVYRVGLRGGFTCPNRDGSKGRGGCTFCNPASNGPLGHVPGTPIAEQLLPGIEYIRERHRAGKFLPYFSDYTTTYDDVAALERMYREALDHPDVVGLALGTRPDCLHPAVLDLLERLGRETFVWVELGIESADDETLRSVNRCHTVDESRAAIGELRRRGLAVSAHVILGLPGESPDAMRETARFVADCGAHGVKIHNLHVVRGTALARDYESGVYTPLELDEYVDLAVEFLEHLPPELIVQRVTGEAPRRMTLAPQWSVNKLAVMNAVVGALELRDTWQGRALGHARSELDAPPRMPAGPVYGLTP